LKIKKEEIEKIIRENFISKPEEIPKKIKRLRKNAYKKGIIADNLEGLKDENGNSFTEKSTYYRCFSFTSRHGCGCVKGSPRREWFDNISFLRGSTGWNFYCRVCGQKIGSHTISNS